MTIYSWTMLLEPMFQIFGDFLIMPHCIFLVWFFKYQLKQNTIYRKREQTELNSFLYVKKDNGNYLKGTAYGKKFQDKSGYQIFASKILLPCEGGC